MAVALKVIDTDKFSRHLRSRCVDLANRKVLMTKFVNSEMASDFSAPMNCHGFGRIHHFHRAQSRDWPSNPLPIDPALRALGQPITDSIDVQVFQNAACSWRCWYCFVDFELLSASPEHAEFLTVDELLDFYLQEEDRPRVIDLSGGQPDLVPEWGLWFADAVRTRGLEKEVYIWSDDNLSNDYLWRFLKPHEISRLAQSYNYGRVGCFKGFDDYSFSFNTGAEATLFNGQFELMKRLVDSEFDVYSYVTFTSDRCDEIEAKIHRFADRLQKEIHEAFPLRVVPLEIRRFTPTQGRMRGEHETSMEIQRIAVGAWQQELQMRFGESELRKKIYEHSIVG